MTRLLPQQASTRPQRHLTASLLLGFTSLASIALLAGAAQPGQQALSLTSTPAQRSNVVAAGTAADPLIAERKQEISDDSARLLTLAEALKSEVDKTSKDTLSIGVVRKAGEIEKLAHTVKNHMRQ
ncbi:MAG: hypothetical protein WBF42_15485 [Terracidiphilus sp.]